MDKQSLGSYIKAFLSIVGKRISEGILQGHLVPQFKASIVEGVNNIMYTFTIQVYIANVYIIFLPPFR